MYYSGYCGLSICIHVLLRLLWSIDLYSRITQVIVAYRSVFMYYSGYYGLSICIHVLLRLLWSIYLYSHITQVIMVYLAVLVYYLGYEQLQSFLEGIAHTVVYEGIA